ncbi:MAG: D-ribitol-5-phosphate cytidylyltransferase [Fibromonadaceae bacterium]|jgi:2-C-methyl-D-erythritol 4-phosphate cytidylyltransferase|nr:D-ribitol-5-phosphate cytidylyltransferase [Fibromonadaceae bacterium]
MIYAGILAAGIGTRMHRQDMPKQFLPLGEKPILIHTLEQFIVNQKIEKILIIVPDEWKLYAEDMLLQYDFMGKEYVVISGGVNKTESIGTSVDYIDEMWQIKENDILIAHDAIRPFITQRLIDEHIETVKKYGAANTAMVTNDAILVSKNGTLLDEVPNHQHLYAEQTPQSYSLVKLKEFLKKIKDRGVPLHNENELPRLWLKEKYEMRLVRGEYFNMKIINPYDLEVAEALLKERSA